MRRSKMSEDAVVGKASQASSKTASPAEWSLCSAGDVHGADGCGWLL